MTVFRRIEANGYRCLREVNQTLNPFEILVGPNGSGKSTFLDVVRFLSDFMGDGLQAAVDRRVPAFQDLVWGRQGFKFQFKAEFEIPQEERLWTAQNSSASGLSYSLAVSLDEQAGKIQVVYEDVALIFGQGAAAPQPVMARTGERIRYRAEGGDQEFVRDRLRNRSGFQTLPGDDIFPAVAWLRDLLEDGVRTVSLEPRALAGPSPPERETEHVIAGSSLPWLIWRMQQDGPMEFKEWTSHMRTALPDVCKVESILLPNENRRFVRIQYENGVQVPAWMLSEGTLRLLALTILAYLPDFHGVYLIEEPENGVHPSALETIYQSLSSVYNAQVLVATHSPVLLSMAKPEQILCFSKTPDGTQIIRGSEHPALKEWQGEVSLGTMVASGILG